MQDENHEAALLNPESRLPNPAIKRMRWRCRRGLLELDIVLGRFVAAHYAGLDAEQQEAFDALLDLPDTVLWDMITGQREPQQASQQRLLASIRAA